MTQQEYAVRADALKGKLYGMAFLYLGSPSLAVDAVDEAVYLGLRACHKLREETFFDTWLTRILINACNTELRRHKREVSMAELPETAQESFDALPLRDAVGRLPRELKDVIILRYFTGLTLAETARTLDLPQGTVVTRQRKALRLLRLELTDGEEAANL
ncbi:sigma-70 family RNA polymerase sigma factor [Intestinimonas sp.]|uniref:sigma-70 family RNA polymerase sigma factor n=1 Tax=Intestinimonas sp. TaxID=1965293 RepID=UPI0026079310|nr:sigma-70 family RNA polymerase sigma factor [Intestinimonas sp.]